MLYRLYIQGMMASLAPPGAPDVDVLVLSPDQTVIASVQVKTRTYGVDRGWHMSKKHESIAEDRLYYAFVDLEPELPVSYIVPSGTVADVVRESHAAWLRAPGQGGRTRRDSTFRRLTPNYSPLEVPGFEGPWLEEHRERWDHLALAVGKESSS